MTKEGLYEAGDKAIYKGRLRTLTADQAKKLNEEKLNKKEEETTYLEQAAEATKNNTIQGDGGKTFADLVASQNQLKAEDKNKAKDENKEIKKNITKNTQKVAEKTKKAIESYDNDPNSTKKTKEERQKDANRILNDEEEKTGSEDTKNGGLNKAETTKGGVNTAESKNKEDSPKEDSPNRDENSEQSEKKDESSRDSSDTLGDLANDKNAFAKYLNTQYPTTIGAIISPNSGLSMSERISMATKLVGKITGNAILANGMSLLGDNSYFSRIGEGVDLNSMTSDQQKKLADAIAEQTSEMAKDVVANRKVVDSFFSPKQEDEDEQTYKNKKEFLSGYGHVLSTMNDDELEDVLKSKGFNKQQISSVKKAKPFFKNSSKTSRDNIRDITETKSKEVEFKFQKFQNESEKRSALREIDNRISELENEKLTLGETYNVNKVIDAYKKFADTMGAIGSSSYSSSSTMNSSQQSASQWNASLSGKVPFVSANVSGGHSWGNSTSAGMSDGSNVTYNENYAYGGKKGEEAYKKWWNDNGQKVYSLLIESIDEQIENLKVDRNKLATMDIGVDDAVIGNGEIDSIQLKDGTTLDVNDGDGALITTNPINKTCLSFAEGEVNPFEWLGYEGKKLTQAEAETIFDSKPLDGYDNIMNWLNS